MNVTSVVTSNAPLPVGPYSQAVVCGNMLFVSGQMPLDPVNGRVVGTTIEEQARQALTNLLAIVGSQGEDVYLIVKTTVYLKDINHFPAFNAVYESMLGSRCPARSVIAVNGLPKNVLVEIEAIACR